MCISSQPMQRHKFKPGRWSQDVCAYCYRCRNDWGHLSTKQKAFKISLHVLCWTLGLSLTCLFIAYFIFHS